MSENGRVQVQEGYYALEKYNTLERFISYHCQIQVVLDAGAQTLLEIGPGSNVVSSYLKSAGVKVTTCDFDPSVSPDIVADVRKLPVENGTFDAVMACQVLEHIPWEDVPGALAELARASKKHVIVSLPYRTTYVNVVLKFPFIRRLFKRNFFDLWLPIPLTFHGFATSHQHYWEISRNNMPMRDVRRLLSKDFRIIKEVSPPLDKYRYFFILEKK